MSNYRVSVPGTPSGIRAPPTIRHSQYSRATHGSPPARGGLGGGRAALDYPPDSTPQTPRCARCFRRYRGPFPETCPPPPDPPLAGGELCCAQGVLWRGLASGCRVSVHGTPSVIRPPPTICHSHSPRATHGSPPGRGGTVLRTGGFVAWVGVRVAGVGSGEFPPASDAPPTIRHPQYSPCNARLPPSQGGTCAAHRRGVGVRGKGDARGHLSRCRRPASRRRPSTATGWRP